MLSANAPTSHFLRTSLFYRVTPNFTSKKSIALEFAPTNLHEENEYRPDEYEYTSDAHRELPFAVNREFTTSCAARSWLHGFSTGSRFQTRQYSQFSTRQYSKFSIRKYSNYNMQDPDYETTEFPDYTGYKRDRSNGHDNRTFAYTMIGLAGAGVAIGTKQMVVTAIQSLLPLDSLVAAGFTEIDLSNIEVGQTVTFQWQKKPVYVRRRSQEEIESNNAVDLSTLRDPETDADRVQRSEWLVLIGICTHLGCVPISNAGDFHGFFCPCHGSHYDYLGRIRKGPAPKNLEVPRYEFIDDNTIRVG